MSRGVPAMTVPAAAPTRMGADEAAAVHSAIKRVLDEGPWIGGPAIDEFETKFAEASGIAHVIGTGNGTDALVLALLSLALPTASGVLVAANEGGYAASAARMIGLVPVVMDVDEQTMEPTAELAERAWRPGVSALVVTHLHGNPVDLAELDDWCRGLDIRLIEDCAQAHGAIRDGRQVGTTGDAAAFSFYPTKNLGTAGDAGAVGFADSGVADRAKALRQYGWGERHRVDIPGGRNSRLDPLHAAILTARLPWLPERNERRRRIAERYRAAIEGSEMKLLGDPRSSVVHHAVVATSDRDALARYLAAHGVTTAIHYPYLLGEMPGLEVEGDPTPHAARWRDRILSLPSFPELTEEEIDAVESALASWGSR